MIKKLNKRTQQEAVGFVIIVMIVIILGVIFLGISLRNKGKAVSYEDAEIANFLVASSSYTSECYKDNEPFYRTLGDLTKDCYLRDFKQIACPSGRNACEVLNATYSDMMKSFAPAGKLIYYKLNFYQEKLVASEDPLAEMEKQRSGFMVIENGNSNQCGTKRGGRTQISADEGNVITELEICPAI
jgi:hypothetical protein